MASARFPDGETQIPFGNDKPEMSDNGRRGEPEGRSGGWRGERNG
jgi:hypothetical protein